MKFSATIFALALAALAGPALAEGDAAAGATVFKKCQACHMVVTPDGRKLAGLSGRVGPDLYGLDGRQAGSVAEFRYSKWLKEAGEKGLDWNEDDFVAYVADPTGFLRDKLGTQAARGNMTFKLTNAQEARDVYAYINSLK